MLRAALMNAVLMAVLYYLELIMTSNRTVLLTACMRFGACRCMSATAASSHPAAIRSLALGAPSVLHWSKSKSKQTDPERSSADAKGWPKVGTKLKLKASGQSWLMSLVSLLQVDERNAREWHCRAAAHGGGGDPRVALHWSKHSKKERL